MSKNRNVPDLSQIKALAAQQRERNEKKSGYLRRLKQTREFILEFSKKAKVKPEEWDPDIILFAVEFWVDDEGRTNTVSNSAILELKTRILAILREFNNQLSFADAETVRREVNNLTIKRCLNGCHKTPKKAMTVKMTEAVRLMTHMMIDRHTSEQRQRLHDCRMLCWTFVLATGARVADVIHTRFCDSEKGQVHGLKTIKFSLRYSKSNQRGLYSDANTLIQNKGCPILCPVSMFEHFLARNKILPKLGLMQKVDISGEWENTNPRELNLEETSFSTASIVRGWNDYAKKHAMTRIAGKIGAHTGRNTRLNMTLTLAENDECVRDTANWRSTAMLSVYQRQQILNPKNPALKYATMGAEKITQLNEHIY